MGDIGSRQVRFEVLPTSAVEADRPERRPEPVASPVVDAGPRERHVARAEPART